MYWWNWNCLASLFDTYLPFLGNGSWYQDWYFLGRNRKLNKNVSKTDLRISNFRCSNRLMDFWRSRIGRCRHPGASKPWGQVRKRYFRCWNQLVSLSWPLLCSYRVLDRMLGRFCSRYLGHSFPMNLATGWILQVVLQWRSCRCRWLLGMIWFSLGSSKICHHRGCRWCPSPNFLLGFCSFMDGFWMFEGRLLHQQFKLSYSHQKVRMVDHFDHFKPN